MKLKNGNKILITLFVAILFAIVFTTSSIVIINKTKKLSFASSYNFDSGSLNSNSTKYDSYTISSVDGFRNFVASVNGDSGYNFSGKTVNLTSDIDLSNASVATMGAYYTYDASGGRGSIRMYRTVDDYFAGTFNGNNHVIKNFSITGNSFSDSKSYSNQGYGESAQYCLTGLFGRTKNATIKNLQLENVSFNRTICSVSAGQGGSSSTQYLQIVGCLVGYAQESTTITNCSVKNMNTSLSSTLISGGTNVDGGVTAEQASKYAYIAGLVGAGSATVTNCYADNITCSHTGANIYGIGPCATNISVTNTLASISKDFGSSTTVTNCVSKLSNVSKCTTNVSGNCNSSSTYTVLSSCSASGTDTNSWYRATDYNDGFPILRQFMSWKTVEFSSNISASGLSFSPTSIKIPSDANKVYDSTSSPTITIYDQDVTINLQSSSAHSCYEFTNWTAESCTRYIANLDYKIGTITFKTSEANVQINDFTSPLSYQIKCGTQISTTINYDKIQINFTDSSGTSNTITFSFDSENSIYYFEKINLTEDTIHFIGTNNVSIEPEIKLKEYTFQFE